VQFQMDQALEVLTQTPEVLSALLRGKSAVWLDCRKTPEAFSAIDVMGHLIHAEMTDWIPRIRIMLDYQDKKTFEPFDRFAFQHLIAGKTVAELLDKFAELRQQNLLALREFCITEPQFNLPGMHPSFGPVTLGNLLATWVVHDLGHISQIVKTMACEYRDAVGPWRAFTTILD
jgi:DinB superfamily